MTILKNCRFVNGEVKDLSFAHGKWTKHTNTTDVIQIPEDCYVSSGWIDMHTHCFKKYETYSDDIDTIGYRSGVAYVVDAGTAGSDTMQEFYHQIQHAKTNVLAFLNIAKQGIQAQNELADLANIDETAIKDTYRKYSDVMVGLKARMSRSVLQGNDCIPLDIARRVADELHVPIMVHIGNEPAKLEDVFDRLKKKDIVTHIFNPKQNGIYNSDQHLKKAVKNAHQNGIHFDLGHGSESFSFKVCEQAYQDGCLCDTISTDIYSHNRTCGPVYSLSHTMSKMLSCGYSLEDVIDRVTIHPAQCLGREDLVSMEEGTPVNVTIFKVVDGAAEAKDSLQVSRKLTKVIQPVAIIINGEYITLD